mgnify:CR=1 FL=1
MKIGFIISIGLTILAFNWTTYKDTTLHLQPEDSKSEEEVKIVRTAQKKKTTPPPPVVKPSTEIILDELEFNPEPEPEVIDEKIEVDPKEEPTELPAQPAVEKVVPPTPLPTKEPEVEEVKILDFAEEMPRFAGCEDILDDKDKRRLCSEEKLLKYIYSEIKYPPIARQNGVEGLVMIQFVVDKDGSIGDIKITKDIGAGCGKETSRVVKNMPTWIPGKQRGKEVAVRYNLPIKFKLKGM